MFLQTNEIIPINPAMRVPENSSANNAQFVSTRFGVVRVEEIVNGPFTFYSAECNGFLAVGNTRPEAVSQIEHQLKNDELSGEQLFTGR